MKRDRKRKPVEQEAVKTTIVGGRPPGSGKPAGDIPRGIEVLVKKASVDPAFKGLLLRERSEAAKEIGLELKPSEVAMINAVPEAQLESIISRVEIPEKHRAIFLGKAAALMILALGTLSSGCSRIPVTEGIAPDRPLFIGSEELKDDVEGE
jgi:hypothetical protein